MGAGKTTVIKEICISWEVAIILVAPLIPSSTNTIIPVENLPFRSYRLQESGRAFRSGHLKSI